jgi:hypothetical protein
MRDDEQPLRTRETDEDKSRFIERVERIKNRDRQRIVEGGYRLRECHPMGAFIPCCLSRIPGEPNTPYPLLSIFAHVSRSPTARLNTGRAGVWSRQSDTK